MYSPHQQWFTHQSYILLHHIININNGEYKNSATQIHTEEYNIEQKAATI